MNAFVATGRKGVVIITEDHQITIENMSYFSDGTTNDMDTLEQLLLSKSPVESMSINSDCVEVNIVNAHGEILFTIYDKCDDIDPEHTMLTAYGKNQLAEVIQISKGLNHTV